MIGFFLFFCIDLYIDFLTDITTRSVNMTATSLPRCNLCYLTHACDEEQQPTPARVKARRQRRTV